MSLLRSPNGVIGEHGEGIAEVVSGRVARGQWVGGFVGWTIILDQATSDSLRQPEGARESEDRSRGKGA